MKATIRPEKLRCENPDPAKTKVLFQSSFVGRVSSPFLSTLKYIIRIQRQHAADRPRPPPPPAAQAGFLQLVARNGGTHVGLGLPGLREAGRGAVGGHTTPNHSIFPFPLTHITHLSSTKALPSLKEYALGLCL